MLEGNKLADVLTVRLVKKIKDAARLSGFQLLREPILSNVFRREQAGFQTLQQKRKKRKGKKRERKKGKEKKGKEKRERKKERGKERKKGFCQIL